MGVFVRRVIKDRINAAQPIVDINGVNLEEERNDPHSQ